MSGPIMDFHEIRRAVHPGINTLRRGLSEL